MRLPLRDCQDLFFGAPLIGLLFVGEAFLYFPALLNSGQLSPQSDSIGIPMYGTLLGSPILMVILALWAAPALRGAEGRPKLFAWRRERPLRSALGTIFYGGAALLIGFDIVRILASAEQGFELLLLISALPLMLWNIALQAACVDRPLQPEPELSLG